MASPFVTGRLLIKAMYVLVFVGACAYFTYYTSQSTVSAVDQGQKSEASPAYKWTCLTDSAAFAKGYNFQLFVVRDTLWLMHHTGGWFSTDGKTWSKSSLSNIIKNNAFLDYVWFRGALYGLGTFDGNIENYTLTTAVHCTHDMRTWETLAENSNLPKRFFYHPFVFQDKLWLIGGSDGTTTYSDVWNSTDGVHWKKQADQLPFGSRERSEVVVFNNRLYLLNSDVWSSTDGLHWLQVTNHIANQTIFGYAPIVFDHQLWLLGCNRDGVFQSQVLVSRDGKAWQTMAAPWSPRGAMAACLYKNEVVMTGGKYGGFTKDGHSTEFIYSNDVWTLKKQ